MDTKLPMITCFQDQELQNAMFNYGDLTMMYTLLDYKFKNWKSSNKLKSAPF